ncbi:TPA: DUF6602 domain-containing protein [Serratia fonticola]
MKPNFLDVYIHMDDSWDSISTYRVQRITDSELILSFASDLCSKKHVRTLSIKEKHKLQIYPFSIFPYENQELSILMSRVGDLVCAFLSKHVTLTFDNLSGLLLKHKEKYNFDEFQIDWTLRCLTAREIIVPTCNKGTVSFSISPTHRARENERKFSATIAGELESLSERVRFIIDHGPSVGMYRENLLQSTLRKHLPERYHIATGFIFGLNKQIDILIYDRVDYAPVFREGDLVIVPPESVRAVIEVKTNLKSDNLQSALELLDLVSYFDDNQPPFFKGIFAFESKLKTDTLYQDIANFYADCHAQAQGAPGVLICHPFQHVTCVCVNGKAFAYTRYNRNKNKRLVPVLYSKGSATGLKSQSSFFIQSLLSYLKFGGMKRCKIDYMERMLGEDTCINKINELIEYDDSWGAYYAYDEGNVEEDAVEEMENLICSAQCWIDGEDNFEAVSPV